MNTQQSDQSTSAIRVIAPSQSWSQRKNQRGYNRSQERLELLGYMVGFGKNVREVLHFGTAVREQRAQDFNEAYADKDVDLVMALSGGWSANEILPLIDWDLVKANPKPLIGYSDITALLNAIYAKTGQVSYLGPNFSTIGRMPGWQYTLDNFITAMQQTTELNLAGSKYWGENGRERFRTKPWRVLQSGEAEAVLLGGNLGTLYLLQGTEYLPRFDKPFIFALEDDDEAGKTTAREVSRRFESLLQVPGFRDNLAGIIIGRFQRGSKTTDTDVASIIASKNLGSIPIVDRVDFGHTLPMLTLPIGGRVRLSAGRTASIHVCV